MLELLGMFWSLWCWIKSLSSNCSWNYNHTRDSCVLHNQIPIDYDGRLKTFFAMDVFPYGCVSDKLYIKLIAILGWIIINRMEFWECFDLLWCWIKSLSSNCSRNYNHMRDSWCKIAVGLCRQIGQLLLNICQMNLTNSGRNPKIIQTNWPTFIEYLPMKSNKFRKKSKNYLDKSTNFH